LYPLMESAKPGRGREGTRNLEAQPQAAWSMRFGSIAVPTTA
jgi:hypothetical protein